MEGSKPDIKKIVLRKRVKQDVTPDLNSEPIVEANLEQAPPTEEDSSKYFYEGEIFDQFYRPLKVQGGVERLTELVAVPNTPVEPPPRESARQREAIAAERQSIAEALAHQIFQLAQRERETQLDIYLSAFNVALAKRSVQESQDILARAHEFFTERYYALIRERGERPDIYAQIIKRVGHSHAERLQKVVFGLDVEETARKLWELRHGSHPNKSSRMLDILLDCTESQVLALREEYLRLPFKELARQLHGVLNRAPVEATSSARRTIGKTELTEHKRASAFRARDQVRTLRNLLLGRGTTELALVKRFYIELGDQGLPDSELSIESHVKKLFPPNEVQRLLHVLSGWTARTEAEEVHRILMGRTFRGVLDDQYGDPQDIVEREWTQGLGPFLRRFKKCRLVRLSPSVTSRSFLAFQELRERIAALSYAQFSATNEVLMEHYGYELDSTIFPSLELFDARQRAELVRERLNVSFDIFEALQPMELLEPRRCLEVQKAYQCLFGRSIREAVEARLQQIGLVMSPQEIATIMGRYVDGQARAPLNEDLLIAYQDDGRSGGVWDPEYNIKPEEDARARAIATLLEQDLMPADVDRVVREALFGLSVESLHALERAFYELTDPHTPLREALEEVMSPDGYAALMVSFGGHDPSALVQRLHEDPIYSVKLRDLPAGSIVFIRESFKRLFFNDLIEHVTRAGEQGDDNDLAIEALSALLKPEILSVRYLLGSMKRETALELESLRRVCSGSALKVMAFERGYDTSFPTLRVHLKLAAARMGLTVSSFVELIFLLEGVDPDILARLQECFDSLDIQLLQEILRAHKSTQTIIEESYDLLYPDRTFRHALKEMSVDPDLINETLLHLEGYCAFSVAKELHDLVHKRNGADLASAVIAVLTPQVGDQVNDRIPQDINWMDEMIYQIGLSYRRQFGESLVASCRSKGVDSTTLEDLVGRIYGLEISSSARELFTLIKSAKEGTPAPDGAEARICSYLESRGPKYRERVLSAYQSYWSQYPGFGGLLDDLTKYFKDSATKRKLLGMFLSTTSDKRTVPPTIPDIH